MGLERRPPRDGAGLAEVAPIGSAAKLDCRFGWSVCSCELLNLLEATRERNWDLAPAELDAKLRRCS